MSSEVISQNLLHACIRDPDFQNSGNYFCKIVDKSYSCKNIMYLQLFLLLKRSEGKWTKIRKKFKSSMPLHHITQEGPKGVSSSVQRQSFEGRTQPKYECSSYSHLHNSTHFLHVLLWLYNIDSNSFCKIHRSNSWQNAFHIYHIYFV